MELFTAIGKECRPKVPIFPFKEIVAYETLWNDRATSFKSLSNLFAANPGCRPSDFVSDEILSANYQAIRDLVLNPDLPYRVNMLISGAFDYPRRLRDAKEPVEVLYYAGNLDILHSKSVAVVGSRKPSGEGLKRAESLVRQLVNEGFTIASGLAEGIDRQAHESAIKFGGRTLAVIGTAMNHFYPKENKDLQIFIAKNHLLVSQVPFQRYQQQSIFGNRLFFPERNKTMSALSEATIIVEAGETSGTLIQARAALHQNRKLFILNSCFENKNITWPEKFLKLGAIRVREMGDILTALNDK